MSANRIGRVQRFGHVGVVVDDLQLVTAFLPSTASGHGTAASLSQLLE